MSSRPIKVKLFRFILFFFLVSLIFLISWASFKFIKLKNSTKRGWFKPPTSLYSSPIEIYRGQKLNPMALNQLLNELKYSERGPSESLGPLEFSFFPESECRNRLGLETQDQTRTCFLLFQEDGRKYLVELSYNKVLQLYRLEESEALPVSSLKTRPLLITQFSGMQFVKRSQVSLSEVPRYCIDAVLAIEDDRFLNHQGISLRGILRAAITNLRSKRLSQGGSTLTQQLVKNKYLTAEKTLSRKINEAGLSLLLELLLSKEEILESYLNYIYWGKSGPYSIHGIQEASRLYFAKDVSQLNLSECSLLAGAIKGPGIYGPHRDKSKERQLQVLNRMKELQLISSQEKEEALNQFVSVSYHKNKNRKLKAPYYIDAVLKKLGSLGFKEREGLKVYTKLNYFAQGALEKSLDDYLKNRSKGFYGSVLIGDQRDHSVAALASGRSNSLNFNSAIEAKRQIGSIAKPFVYLTALEQKDITPLTEIPNDTFTYEYEGQTWTPKNYSSKNQAPYYPLFLALPLSKNIPTVRLMSSFGYKKVYRNLLKFGFDEFSPVTPSLALGSFESSPLKVLEAYMKLSSANFDAKDPVFIDKIEDFEGKLLHQSSKLSSKQSSQNLPLAQRQLLEMMQNTLKFGTARASQKIGLKGFYAGKTGTTNQHQDAWFATTSPLFTSVVWVGKAPYLSSREIKLTGATAALPIWMSLTKELEKQGLYAKENWPYDPSELKEVTLQSPHGEAHVLLKSKKDSFFW